MSEEHKFDMTDLKLSGLLQEQLITALQEYKNNPSKVNLFTVKYHKSQCERIMLNNDNLKRYYEMLISVK